MGLISRLLEFTRVTRNTAKVSDVRVDPGGGANVTAQHFSSPGDDAFPLQGDYVAGQMVQQTGRVAAIGYLDPKNTQKAQQGDKRIYARDTGTGAAIVEVWLKNTGEGVLSNDNGSVTLRPDGGVVGVTPGCTFDVAADGSITGSNAAGSFQLQAGGAFVVNGVIIGVDGSITAPSTLNVTGAVVMATSLTLAGSEIAAHTHDILSGSSAPGPTGPNN